MRTRIAGPGFGVRASSAYRSPPRDLPRGTRWPQRSWKMCLSPLLRLLWPWRALLSTSVTARMPWRRFLASFASVRLWTILRTEPLSLAQPEPLRFAALFAPAGPARPVISAANARHNWAGANESRRVHRREGRRFGSPRCLHSLDRSWRGLRPLRQPLPGFGEHSRRRLQPRDRGGSIWRTESQRHT